MVDTHTHGYRSYDADADYKEMIASARQNGLTGICFTDHYEYIPDSDTFCGFEMMDHIAELHSFAENVSDSNFKVLAGAEFGLYDSHMEEIQYALKHYPLDCVIGSVHYMKGYSDPYYPAYTAGLDKWEAYAKILEKYIELIPQYAGIHILGHFDYVSRYSQTYSDRNMYYTDFPDHFDKILTMIIERGISLEVNTSTYVKRDHRPANQLDPMVLRRYKELGGEMISLGSDAHSPTAVAQLFSETAQLIQSIGFSYLTHFEKGKPVFNKIDSL